MNQSTTSTPHRIVIVGGGAGGFELATRLGDTLGRRGKAEITLIERKHSHVWKPKLHEIAAGSMDFRRPRGRLPRACPPAWLSASASAR
jgi:NADH dehydrogenase